jgi:hypothetical protein
VASIIQLHNTNNGIVTTLLQGLQREEWKTVWAHMRATKAAIGGTEPRVRNTLLRYGQLLHKHKSDGISGIYPMNIPGHWRVMIVSHTLRQVMLLDPLGDGFTQSEIENVQHSYRGYNVTTNTKRLQTDGWNCGVWVAWIATLWTAHVASGLEGTRDINEVIQQGLLAEGIQDINAQPLAEPHNESSILRFRRQFRRMLYAKHLPAHLTEWLARWNTPLSEVLTVSTVAHLPRGRCNANTKAPRLVDHTGIASDTNSTTPPPGGASPPPPSGEDTGPA